MLWDLATKMNKVNWSIQITLSKLVPRRKFSSSRKYWPQAGRGRRKDSSIPKCVFPKNGLENNYFLWNESANNGVKPYLKEYS